MKNDLMERMREYYARRSERSIACETDTYEADIRGDEVNEPGLKFKDLTETELEMVSAAFNSYYEMRVRCTVYPLRGEIYGLRRSINRDVADEVLDETLGYVPDYQIVGV